MTDLRELFTSGQLALMERMQAELARRASEQESQEEAKWQEKKTHPIDTSSN